ncbi:MAG: hypothetical protein E6Q56_01395 [Mycobacterium sp.]|nr:MAG: hypothetical protein E6Q56_01395 [Mycobacterium sp.]
MTRRALQGPPLRRNPPVPREELPFPTGAQLDLVKAAVLPADSAAPAWRRWKARGIPLEAVDPASGRLFSHLWTNRVAAGIGAEDLPLLKGIYRQTLANNAVVLDGAFEVTQPLIDAGIPVLFIKGSAVIAVAGSHRLGLRRIIDADVLVPEADADRAVAIVRAAGYQAKTPDYGLPLPAETNHAWTCVTSNGSELDLHWWAFKTAGDDVSMFETARTATLLGRSVLIPSATEVLVAAVAQAFSGAPARTPLRWIADAMLIFDLEADLIDWGALLRRSRRPGLTLGLSSGLDFLAREFGAPVPKEVLSELQRRPVSLRERGAHLAACRDLRRVGRLLFQLELHRTRRLRDPAEVPRDFLGHLAQATGARTGKRRDVFERQAARAVQRLTRPETFSR